MVSKRSICRFSAHAVHCFGLCAMCARVFPNRNCIQPRNRQPDRIDRQVNVAEEITRRATVDVPHQMIGPERPTFLKSTRSANLCEPGFALKHVNNAASQQAAEKVSSLGGWCFSSSCASNGAGVNCMLNGLQFILRKEGPLKKALSSFCCIFPQPVTACPSTLFPKAFVSLPAAYQTPRKFAFPGAASCTPPPPSADFGRSVPLPGVASSDRGDSRSLS